MPIWVVAHTVAVAVFCFSMCSCFRHSTAIVHREMFVTLLIQSFVRSVTPVR